ncbi:MULTISPECIES: hypothetical protein [unclassified Halomonas]|uniref:hypothetical protein n=1 Tax=unclassified Halomonas TaxID=2609666 RepID=UPI0007D91DB3|nr:MULTISPECIES: hypothetical protein [unclassified Halomonas]MBT2789036.1 hypothetical protein [Halomonas sp. ISL-106]MBT2799654.1 hypothetical protein [Halomonas sp. ISL-104]OAL60163.1 hypothetical protein A6R74_20915 [Halomonas sp. ALS9]
MSYQPSIEDIAYLAQNQPERFSSPATTLRSIQNAMQADDVQRETLEAMTAQNHYNNFLANGGEALTESPIPPMPLPVLEGRPQAQDPEFGAPCTVCASQTPCIEKVEVVCHTHAKRNQRVILQGENELVDTECKIYFVADKFVTGEGTLEDFFEGTQLKDEGNVAITLADDCSHGQHTLYWIDELNGTELPPGATTTLDFTAMTRPVSPITIPSVLIGLVPTDAELALKVAVMLLNMMMNRAAMVNEQTFRITYDGTNDFTFTAVTLPQLKFDGLITVAPPSVDTRSVEKKEGQEVAAQQNMGPRVRKITERQGWGFHADLTFVCGSHNDTITVGTSPSDTVTYDTGPSMRRAENQRQQQNTVERFIGTLTNASQRIASSLSGTESNGSQLFSFYTRGPELMLGATTEQAEEEGAPGATWKITPGLSIAYECGINIDIYQALKKAIEVVGGSWRGWVTPTGIAARSLLAFLNDAEKGRETWALSYQFAPYLYMEVGLGVGPQPTEETLGNHMLRADFNYKKGRLENPDGQISITLKAVIAGGMMGYYDHLWTERTVFNYGAEVSTSGSITIAIENDQWGYQLSHTGAVVRVQGYKKGDVTERDSQSSDGGRSRQTQHSSAKTVETEDGTRWVADGTTRAYRLADSWTGAFHAFNNGD